MRPAPRCQERVYTSAALIFHPAVNIQQKPSPLIWRRLGLRKLSPQIDATENTSQTRGRVISARSASLLRHPGATGTLVFALGMLGILAARVSKRNAGGDRL